MIDRVKIEIKGKNPDYLFKEMIHHKMNIYSFEKDKNTIRVILDKKDYNEIRKIKTTYQIKIVREYGISHLKRFFKKYKFLIIGFLIGFIFIERMSHLIFQIEINHNNQKLVKVVEKDLKEYGIEKFHWKKNYKEREQIKRKILEKEKNYLEWIEIEEIGTKYKISLEERKKENPKEECIPRNVIAKKNAIILDINTSVGEVKKKKQDYVEKGEIIVSGLIHNKEDIVGKKCARAIIYGETWYNLKVLVPETIKQTKVLKEKKWGITIQIFQKKWSSLNNSSTYKKKEYNIIESKIVPIKLGFSRFQKVKEIERKRTQEEIKSIALEEIENQIQKQISKEEEVLQKKVLKMTKKDSKIEVEVFLKLKENITDFQDIKEEEIKEEKEE